MVVQKEQMNQFNSFTDIYTVRPIGYMTASWEDR